MQTPMKLTFFTLLLFPFSIIAQTNLISTNPVALQVMKGLYNPSAYQSANPLSNHDSIIQGINSRVNPDSLKSYLFSLRTFGNRNSGSDTVSASNGIGAARRWVYAKFQQFSAENDNRLIPSYLQWTQTICGITQHKNIFAVLPGTDTTDKSVMIIEGHIDSRCEILCDTSCVAEGMEDNASGTALVIELARVMSRYSYKRSIVFLITIGEEQGLYGANAFSFYCAQQAIKVRGVLNNDVIGGIICGATSSAPSCPGLNHIDSTQVRLFSYGVYNSFHKGLARFIKLQYKEELLPFVTVPMLITIMTAEDRTGRGGDHQPFRQRNFPAMRFTSANEHGNASNATGYTDRQHSTRDILGLDTDGDQEIDSFFVDFNYLSRNAVINGNAAAMGAIGPKAPDFLLTSNGTDKLYIQVTQQTQYNAYRIGVRTTLNDWDSIYTITGTLYDTISVTPGFTYYVSVASVDNNDIESIFSREYMANLGAVGLTEPVRETGIELLQNRPNPFDETTVIAINVNKNVSYRNMFIRISDLNGKEIERIPVKLAMGMNEFLYEHGYNAAGTYSYSLVADGRVIQSRVMQFAN